MKDFDHIHIVIKDCKVISLKDLATNKIIRSFHERLRKPKISKLYIVKEKGKYLYVGTAIQPLRARIRYGLSAKGKNGYRGYKWKDRENVELLVWCLGELNKRQLENVEAELSYIIRCETGKWPLAQNEIHFNNDFPKGKFIAKRIFQYAKTQSYPSYPVP